MIYSWQDVIQLYSVLLSYRLLGSGLPSLPFLLSSVALQTLLLHSYLILTSERSRTPLPTTTGTLSHLVPNSTF
jgi:hypothetical protein